ncbi:MAG: tetratricopeptide repeat protein [Acidobacteriaceae bacterium]
MKLSLRNRRLYDLPVTVIFLTAVFVTPSYAYQSNRLSGADLKQDYHAAQQARAQGDIVSTASYSKLFIVHALNLLALNFANVGDYDEATSLFDEGLVLDPGDIQMRQDYVQEAIAAGDLEKATELAQEAVERAPRNASAHLALGRVLLLKKENPQAQKQMEMSVALDPNYVDGLALARADLTLKEEAQAATIFNEMLQGFGDTAQLHMDIGLQYAETDYSEQAEGEFKKAIAENDKLPGAHYSLGAAYLQNMGEMNFAKAAAEFRKELEISPNDLLSHSQLGYIAMKQHDFPDAETELLRASTLAPQDPDIDFMLGQLYLEMNQPVKAEAALRRSIELTRDPPRNNYQVQRAHYLLARVLMQSGKVDEARQQIQLSNGLLQQMNQAKQGESAGPAHGEAPAQLPNNNMNRPAVIDAQQLQQAKAVEAKLAPAIADTYNNLGVISAIQKDYKQATTYFQDTSKWAPDLEGLDLNWGRAAFLDGQFGQAIPPLQRYLQSHPADESARSMLTTSLHRTKQDEKNQNKGSIK